MHRQECLMLCNLYAVLFYQDYCLAGKKYKVRVVCFIMREIKIYRSEFSPLTIIVNEKQDNLPQIFYT